MDQAEGLCHRTELNNVNRLVVENVVSLCTLICVIESNLNEFLFDNDFLAWKLVYSSVCQAERRFELRRPLVMKPADTSYAKVFRLYLKSPTKI